MLLNKVVIAEDDEAIQHMLGAFLGDAGFLCLRAVNGRDAVRLVRTQQPDLLILDVMMPELDGFEVAKRLKADPLCSAVPILMLTSLSAVEDRVKGLEQGADDYLPKPFDVRELVARVRALVRARRRERGRDPATGLPSGEALEGHVEERLKAGGAFVLLHIGVVGFSELADRIGFKEADASLAEIGQLLTDCVRRAPSAFLAHVGGDDFVVACDPGDADGLARDALAAFQSARDTLAATPSTPALLLHITGVDTSRTPLHSLEELSKTLADVRSRAKPGDSGTGQPIRWAT